MSNPDTPLLSLIRARISDEGPMSLSDYMTMVLDHPEFGYYRTQDPFGAKGDFVTAPDISQVFGELLGLWLATAWVEAGKPSPFRLVELGPGRGQLLVDLIRATTNVPGFLDAADLHLVESSEKLRDVQRQALGDLSIHWHDRLEDVPSGPLYLIGNEFLDALPIHQLIKTTNAWDERLVGLDDDGALCYTSAPALPELISLIVGGDDAAFGTIAEISSSRTRLSEMLGRRLAEDGGVALLIDYGAWVDRPTGDTLQAVSRHQPIDPLSMPGLADITAQVDFRAIGQAAGEGGAAIYGPVPQGTFLRTLGIEPRIAMLLKEADEDQRQALRGALFRLTDASAMGEVFKVLVLAPPEAPCPPGFVPPALG